VEVERKVSAVAVGRPLATVLLVEGELDRAASIARALVTARYSVRQANDGAAAAAILSRETPDLIAMNLSLPDVDGLVLCSLIREVLDVPILLYGRSNPGRDRLLAQEVGADDLVEDFQSSDELVARLETLLRRGRRV
jgi:DNA-binding response OmpR family regulator